MHGPTHNRLGNSSSYALKTLMRVRGAVTVDLGGITAQAYMPRSQSATDAIMGGIISSGGSRNLLVDKEQHPERPEDNTPVKFITGDLVGDDSFIATTVTDRDGYWLIEVDQEYGG